MFSKLLPSTQRVVQTTFASNTIRNMKTLSKIKPERGIWMQEKPVPVCGYNDVLIKIKKTAICGTDVHLYEWNQWSADNLPIGSTTGHEFCGVIAQVGEGVAGFQKGDRVSGEGHVVCGVCRNCRAGLRHLCRKTYGVGVNRDGAFAEYLSIPAVNAFPIPSTVSDELASIFDPFGNAVHTALSFRLEGEDVLVTGAGPIGIMAAAVAKHVGARRVVITDVNEYRLQLAREMGVTRAVNVAKENLEEVTFKELGLKEGYDVGLEMSGNPTAFKGMLETMNNGGKVAMLGTSDQPYAIDWNKVVFKGLHIKGIYGREMFETWHKMVCLIEGGLNLEPIITHRYEVDDYQKGFDAMMSGTSGKVILNW